VAITLVQSNAATTASGTSGTSPAWGSTTAAGNLLLIVINETGGFTGVWSTPPSGYTAIVSSPSIYHTSTTSPFGMFWKIAAGSDATPPSIGADTGSGGPWSIYTYEFHSPTGWVTSAFDKSVTSAASNTSAASKASGSTAALSQADELAVAHCALEAASAGFAWTGGFTAAQPTGATTYNYFGWQETAATTALSTTPTWTTAQVAGCRIATFKVAAASTVTKSGIHVVRRTWAGA
jgi:hypothetical protein